MFNRMSAVLFSAVFLALLVATVDVFLLREDPKPNFIPPHPTPQDMLRGSQLFTPLTDALKIAPTDPQKALNLVNHSFDELNRQPTTIESAYRLWVLREVAKNSEKSELVKQYTEELSTLGQRDNVVWLNTQLLIESAENKLRTGLFTEGVRDIDDAIEIAEAHNIEFLLMKAYNVAGILYNAINQLKTSHLFFNKGLDIGKKFPEHELNGRFYNNLGLLYVHLEQWEKAIALLEQAYEHFRKQPVASQELLQTTLLNKAYAYDQLNDVVKSREAFEQALTHYSPNAKTFYNAVLLKSKARLLLLEQSYDASISTARECQAFIPQDRYPIQRATCQLIEAEANLLLNKLDTALARIESSIAIFTQIDHQRWLVRAYLLKSDILHQMGQDSEALSLYKTYHQQEREQFLEEVYALEFAFSTQKVQKERDLLAVQNQLNALNLANDSLRFRILMIWILLGVAVTLLIIRKTITVQTLNKELAILSFRDPLTSSFNRRYYQKEIQQPKILDETLNYRILLIDLDWFKKINDTYGHDIGDQVLVETADRISQDVQDDEILVRWGGEEFLWVIQDNENLKTRVNDLLKAFHSQPFNTTEHQLDLTVSIGLSHPLNLTQLRSGQHAFVTADACLYQAKENGRNQAVYPS